MSYSLEELQAMISAFIAERDWSQFHNAKDLAISLNLEAAEVLEHFQWKSEQEVIEHTTKNINDVAEELADVMYWVLLMADKLDIDIAEALVAKLEKNKQKYPIEKARGNHKKYTDLNN